jgi:hypothetical protein
MEVLPLLYLILICYAFKTTFRIFDLMYPKDETAEGNIQLSVNW